MQELCGNPIVEQLQTIVNFLSAGVGIVVVAMIVWGAIQYITAGSDVAGGGKPSQVVVAKQTITNALVALLVFIFMYAFLQWFIPGGVFGSGCGTAPTNTTNPAGPRDPPGGV